MTVEMRKRSDILHDVIDLDDGEFIVTLEIPRYEGFKASGMTDEQIFNEIAMAHDTPTMQELVDENLPEWRLKQFAGSMTAANRKFSHCFVDQNKRRIHAR